MRKYQLDDYKIKNKFSEKLNSYIRKKNNSTEKIFGKTVTNGFNKNKNKNKNFDRATKPYLTYNRRENENNNINIINESDDEEKNIIMNKLKNKKKKKELIAE